MAAAGGIRAGLAFVELYVKDNQLTRGLKDAEKNLKAFGKSVEGVGKGFTDVGKGLTGFGEKLTAVAAAVAAPFVLAVKASGDMTESVSKLEAVFKDSADGVKVWGNQFAREVGRSRKQATDFLADTGALLQGFALDPKQVEEFSKGITRLAVDLGSFFNVADEDALLALRSGLAGEAEPLRRMGVLLSEARVEAELLGRGLDPKTASDQEKVISRYNIILKDTKTAQGDAVRTASSFNNSLKRLWGTVTDLATTVGDALLPVATDLVSQAGKAVAVVGKWASENAEAIRTAARLAAGAVALGVAVTGLGGALQAVGAVLGAAGTAMIGLATAIGLVLSPIGLLAIGLTAGAVAFFKFTAAGQAAVTAVVAKFGELKAAAVTAFGAIAGALKAGDINLAVRVLWATLKVEFVKGLNLLRQLWKDWGVDFVNTFEGVGFELTMQFNTVFGEVKKAFLGLTEDLYSSWSDLVTNMLRRLEPLAAVFGALGIPIGPLLAGAAESPEDRAQREAELGLKQTAIDAETGRANEAIAAERDARAQGRIGAAGGGVERGKGELKRAQEELDAALAAARAARPQTLGLEEHPAGAEAGARDVAPEGAGGNAKAREAVRKALEKFDEEGLDEAVGRAKERIDVKGTTSAFAVQGVSAGDTLQEQVGEQKKTNEKLDKLREEVRKAQAAFVA